MPRTPPRAAALHVLLLLARCAAVPGARTAQDGAPSSPPPATWRLAAADQGQGQGAPPTAASEARLQLPPPSRPEVARLACALCTAHLAAELAKSAAALRGRGADEEAAMLAVEDACNTTGACIV